MATQYGWRPPYIQYAKKGIDWYGIFNEIEEAKQHGDRKVIARICERHPIKPTTLRTRYRQWTRSRRPEAQEGDIGTGCSSQRGGQNRAFSNAEAYELGQYIINVYCNQHIQITTVIFPSSQWKKTNNCILISLVVSLINLLHLVASANDL